MNCPRCKGQGYYRPRHTREVIRCELCQGQQSLHEEFAKRTGSPYREGSRLHCADCDRVGMTLPVKTPEGTVNLCAPCWQREVHPVAEEPLAVPF